MQLNRITVIFIFIISFIQAINAACEKCCNLFKDFGETQVAQSIDISDEAWEHAGGDCEKLSCTFKWSYWYLLSYKKVDYCYSGFNYFYGRHNSSYFGCLPAYDSENKKYLGYVIPCTTDI